MRLGGDRNAAPQIEIIPTERFWAALGADTEEIPAISDLFAGSETDALNETGADILVIAYHQVVDLEDGFLEVVLEGGVEDGDRVTVAVAVLNVANRKLIHVAQSEYENLFIALHFFVVVPAARFTEPNFEPCEFLGEQAGDAIKKHAAGEARPCRSGGHER